MRFKYPVLFILLFAFACKGGDTNPVASTPVIPEAVSQAPVTESPSTEEDPCENDASCGRSVQMSFDEQWTLHTKNSTARNVYVSVCSTNGFRGPGVAHNTYLTHGNSNIEKPNEESFPYELPVIDDWKEDECSRTLKLQVDGYIGEKCSGKIYAVVMPSKDSTRTITREAGEWNWTSWEIHKEGKWGDCVPPTNVDASTIQYECRRARTNVYKRVASKICSEETEEQFTKRIEYDSCTCPCIETGPTDIPQEAIWFEEILEGHCDEVVLPLPTLFDSSTRNRCHQLGNQLITEDYICKDDPERTRDLCRNVKCPVICENNPPAEGVYPKQGNEFAECSYFGNYVPYDKDEHKPWDLNDGLFYLIKAGQFMRLEHDKPHRFQSLVKVDRWRTISHITVCGCPIS